MIDRSISTSRKLMKVSDRSAIIFTWLIPHTDSWGKMDGDAHMVKATVVPLRDYSIDEVEESLQELVKVGLITRYEVEDETYLRIVNFDEHQTFRNDRSRKAQFPSEDGSFEQDAPTGTPPVDQRHTTDIPTGDSKHGSKVKLSKVEVKKKEPPPLHRTQSYLTNIPAEDIKEFTSRFEATAQNIKSKGEDLDNWCEANGKRKKDYKRFLLNALKKDFRELTESERAERKPRMVAKLNPDGTPVVKNGSVVMVEAND